MHTKIVVYRMPFKEYFRLARIIFIEKNPILFYIKNNLVASHSVAFDCISFEF